MLALARSVWDVVCIMSDAARDGYRTVRPKRTRNALTEVIVSNPADDPEWQKYHNSRQWGR